MLPHLAAGAVAMAEALGMFEPPAPACAAGVHPNATVDPTAVIGEGVSIGAGCYVGAGAQIGARLVEHVSTAQFKKIFALVLVGLASYLFLKK